MALELSPYDVAIWFVRESGSSSRVSLVAEADWDSPPYEKDWDLREDPKAPRRPFHFATLAELEGALREDPIPSESALLDAASLLHRGDYSGAVRRCVTAIEVLLESRMRAELSKSVSSEEAERRLKKTRMDFAKRISDYCTLTRRTFDPRQLDQLTKIRDLRHAIVHRGQRLTYADSGRAHWCVDHARWIYNWFENDEPRRKRRERLLVQRKLGGQLPIVFDARITADGVTVTRPPRTTI
jgi:hypothetical protein